MIAEALIHFCGDKSWSLNGDSYSGLNWTDESPKPTEEQVNQWAIDIVPIHANKKAQQNRANAYRSEADPLFFKWQRNEATEQEYLDKVQEIRARYPYV